MACIDRGYYYESDRPSLIRDARAIVAKHSFLSPKNETEAPGFRHGEEVGCGFNRLQ
jgi:hypothetical protein